MLKFSYAGCFDPSLAISAKFIFRMCVAARNREKVTKTHYFECSGSSTVIDVYTSNKCTKHQFIHLLTATCNE